MWFAPHLKYAHQLRGLQFQRRKATIFSPLPSSHSICASVEPILIKLVAYGGLATNDDNIVSDQKKRKMKKKYETLRTVIATMNVLNLSLPHRNAKLMRSVRSLISHQLITSIAASTDTVRSAFVVHNVADES